MSRQAKIQITGDARGFKKATDDAKKALENLGKAKVGDTGVKTLSQEIVDLEKKIKSLSESKALLSQGGIKGTELDAWKQLNKEIKENKKLLQEVRASREALSSTPDKRDKLPSEDGERKSRSNPMKSVGSALALAAGGMGLMSMWNVRQGMAQGRLPQRSLTTDSGIAGEHSQLGFTPEERRTRALSMAQQASPTTGKELTKLTDLGEQLERAFGITGETSAGAIGAARRAGVDNQEQYLRKTVGGAQGAGMQGVQVGEYLSSMNGFLSEMSKGVNIDTDSLNGFASSMATLPFFKNDPSRIFDMMKGMNQGFTGGDEFQRAQGMRAISQSAPGAETSGMLMRQGMGIWGNMDKNKKGDADTLKKLQAQGMDTKVLEVTGGEIVKNMMDEIQASTKDMTKMDQAKQLASRLNISDRTALELMANKGNVGKMDNILKEANMSPEDKLREVMSSADGHMVSVEQALQEVKEAMATKIAEPMAALATKIQELIEALGLNSTNVLANIGSVALLGTTILGAFNLIKGFLPSAAAAAAETAGGTAAAGVGMRVAGMGMGTLGLVAGMSTLQGDTGPMTPEQQAQKDALVKQQGEDFMRDTGRFNGVPETRQSFDFGQNDMFPELPKSGSTYQGPLADLATPGMMNNTGLGSGVIAPTDATEKNTSAIERLTDAILKSMGQGGGGSRFPSNASFGRNMAMGK